ncbi:MAG: hypothetical protein AB7G25_07835 [Sphingomonadaceae bacterium]
MIGFSSFSAVSTVLLSIGQVQPLIGCNDLQKVQSDFDVQSLICATNLINMTIHSWNPKLSEDQKASIQKECEAPQREKLTTARSVFLESNHIASSKLNAAFDPKHESEWLDVRKICDATENQNAPN